MHFEVWIEREDGEDERDKLLVLSDTIFEFVHEGCKDLELHDPHVSASMNEDAPDWATSGNLPEDS